jgi:AraC-like DNA-binding protein
MWVGKQYLLLIIVLVCFSGFIILLHKSRKTKKFNYSILGIFLLAIGYIFFFELIISLFGRESDHFFPVLVSYLFYPILLFVAPTIYIYTKSFSINLQDKLTYSQNIKHFLLPFFLLVVNLFSFGALRNLEENSQNFILLTNIVTYLNFGIFFLIFLVQNIFYLYLSVLVYYNHREIFQIDKESTKKTLNWIIIFLTSYAIILMLVYLFQLNSFASGKIILRILVVIYVSGVVLLGSKDYDELQENEIEEKEGNILDEGVINKIREQMNLAIHVNKIYLDPDMNLQIFAHKINSNTKYLSKYINQYYNKSFSNFINELRVQEARELMQDETTKNYTLETIASMCGFNSKSAFNASFKKFYNLPPSEFRESNTTE